MDQLLEYILKQQDVNEFNVGKAIATAAIAGSLLTGTPSVADAHKTKVHHSHGLAHKQYSDNDRINAIVGEAGNQGYQGMLGIACAIRNRAKIPYYKNNVLHGVYGLNAKQLTKEPKVLFQQAAKAWNESATNDIVGGAYMWGSDSDIEKFNKESWFRNMKATVRIKDHTFFKER